LQLAEPQSFCFSISFSARALSIFFALSNIASDSESRPRRSCVWGVFDCVCLSLCMYVCIYVCMYVSMLCLCVCASRVCVCVCRCVCMICIYTSFFPSGCVSKINTPWPWPWPWPWLWRHVHIYSRGERGTGREEGE
jgi:hypothetical protein